MVVEMTRMVPAHREKVEQGGEGWVENPLARDVGEDKTVGK